MEVAEPAAMPELRLAGGRPHPGLARVRGSPSQTPDRDPDRLARREGGPGAAATWGSSPENAGLAAVAPGDRLARAMEYRVAKAQVQVAARLASTADRPGARWGAGAAAGA